MSLLNSVKAEETETVTVKAEETETVTVVETKKKSNYVSEES